MSVQILQGDCREVMATLEPASFDLVIADPPYGDTSLSWDVPPEDWLPLVRSLLKPHGSLWCFGSLRMFMVRGVDFHGWHLAQDVVWEKHNGSSFHADRFKRVHEHIVQFYPRGVKWADVYKRPVTTPDAVRWQVRRKQRPPHIGNIEASSYTSEDGGPRLMRSVIPARSCHGTAEYPTQKPTAILAPLIEYSCPTGGLILDPFAGVASTLVAARLLGRNAVGIEIDPTYCAIGERRLSQQVLPLEEAAV